MLFNTDIFIWVRPANAVGRLSLVLLGIGVFGCNRSRNDSSMPQEGGPRGAATEYDAAEAKRQLQEVMKALDEERAEEKARFEVEIRELERVRDLPPFENALEPKGWWRISRAFVVKKGGDDEVFIAERLFGRMPSDPERYIPGDYPQGLYLVGSLAPLDGYQIDAREGEERFCLSVSGDGEYIEGDGVSAKLPMSEVRRRLDAKVVRDASGVR